MLNPLTAALLLVIVMSGCEAPTIPNAACYWTGFVIIWALVIAAGIGILIFIGLFIWESYLQKIWNNDWFAYNIRRRVIPTEDLQYYFRVLKMNNYWRRNTFKYRLRNIKAASKGNCNNPIHKTK